MCELLGISAGVPANVVFSFTGLALRGGQTGPHADGWGLSLYDGNFARTFREKDPAHSSRLARFLQDNPIPTRQAVAHVRKMTRGVASLVNTHPFVRVFSGRHIVFAHNGTLPNIKAQPLHLESTMGSTDSEHAFCVMLERLRDAYGNRYPEDPVELGEVLYTLGNELGGDAIFNFIWGDGDTLIARCGDNLHSLVWHPPHGEVSLVDAEVRVQLSDLLGDGADAHMAIVATSPLTRGDPWQRAEPGSLRVFSGGQLLHTFDPPPDYVCAPAGAPPWQPE